MKNKIAFAAAIALPVMVLASQGFAASDTKAADHAEMQAALSAKVTMTEAVKAAEVKSGGKAMEAVFSDENGKPGYEVTTVTGDGAEHNLFVDASSGVASRATVSAENENDGNGALDDSEEGESD